MKPFWFIGGIAVAAILIVGVGSALAYQGIGTESNTKIGDTTAQPKACGCTHGAQAGGCGAAGCAEGCAQCQNHAAGGCSGGCHATK
jgi:hypothetical protein